MHFHKIFRKMRYEVQYCKFIFGESLTIDQIDQL